MAEGRETSGPGTFRATQERTGEALPLSQGLFRLLAFQEGADQLLYGILVDDDCVTRRLLFEGHLNVCQTRHVLLNPHIGRLLAAVAQLSDGSAQCPVVHADPPTPTATLSITRLDIGFIPSVSLVKALRQSPLLQVGQYLVKGLLVFCPRRDQIHQKIHGLWSFSAWSEDSSCFFLKGVKWFS